jgi:hypothetical protein
MKFARTAFSVVVPILIATAATADVRLTVYDDGLSCPGNCDAHAVFDPELNGTEFAHDPKTTVAPFAACTLGSPCLLCIKSGGKECFTTTYRGAGPTKNTFDLTPAFFEQTCQSLPEVDALKNKCKELERSAATLQGRINCFHESESAACKSMMKAAVAMQIADRATYDECKRVGEKAFNEAHVEGQRRSNDCAYELKGTGGPNSGGTVWRKLLPGACRAGTLVGRDGLDCCSGIALRDGPLGAECHGFYPKS